MRRAQLTLFLICWIAAVNSEDVRVELEVPRFASRGSSVILRCHHSVKARDLYKVDWLRSDSASTPATKFYQYIKGRQPPYRNTTISGAEIDWSRSNAHQVALKNLDIQASGLYSCEVSLETPIYTKASSDHELTVIIPQSAAPRITFGAREYTVGELLEANCTSVPAHPPPHITWLINGKKVDEKMTRTFPQPISLGHVGKTGTPLLHHDPSTLPPEPPAPMYDIAPHYAKQFGYGYYAHNDADPLKYHVEKGVLYAHTQHHRRHSHEPMFHGKHKQHRLSEGPQPVVAAVRHSAAVYRGVPSTTQLTVAVSELHALEKGHLELTCMATIPAYVNTGDSFADAKVHTVPVNVIITEPSTEASIAIDQVSSANKPYINIIFYLLLLLVRKLLAASK